MANLRSSDHSPAVGDIVKDIQNDIKALVQNEVALAKSEIMPSAKKAGIGGGMLAVAGYFAICAAGLLYIAGSLAIWKWLDIPIALGFVIMAAVLLVLAAVLGLIGVTALKKIKKPERTLVSAKTSVEAVKGAIKQGTAAAKAPLIEGSVADQRALGNARRGR